MLFNSKVFVVFMIVVLAVYYRLGHKGKLWFLLVMSYIFYGFWNPWLCGLIFLSTLVDYTCALRIDAAPTLRMRRAWLGVSLAMNLGALAFFKYYNFFLDSLEFNLQFIGVPIDLHAAHLDLILPVGISFYTFQTLSYTIEVYRGNFKSDANFRDFALFVAFFPQLVAGPVERATHLLPQYKLPFKLTRPAVMEGVFLIGLGFVKKVVIGDRLGRWVEWNFAHTVDSGPVAVMSVLLFTLQIYVDFSAYSDIAIGLGRLLGYDIRPNFNLPFVVPSIPERWRRWHISMGHWFRDYIYFPLGGNRKGAVRTQANIMAVMFLSGLWHGASYNFVIWGVLNGLTMVGHRLLQPVLRPISNLMGRTRPTKLAYFYLCCVNTMFMISFINIFFRSDTWPIAKSYVTSIFLTNPWQFARWVSAGLPSPEHYTDGFLFLLLVFAVHEAQRWFDLRKVILDRTWLWATTCTAMFFYVMLYGIKGPEFIYFQF
jgi:D-alanyl-lipoteichoic acid acyltransferase DltB (MBOAT superfamily)